MSAKQDKDCLSDFQLALFLPCYRQHQFNILAACDMLTGGQRSSSLTKSIDKYAVPPRPLYVPVSLTAPAGAAEVRLQCAKGDKGKLTELIRQLPAPFRGHHSLIFHVALVADQEHLSVVPRVRLDLC